MIVKQCSLFIINYFNITKYKQPSKNPMNSGYFDLYFNPYFVNIM